MFWPEPIREIHSRNESSLSSGSANMRDIGVLVVFAERANNATVEGDLSCKVSQVEMT